MSDVPLIENFHGEIGGNFVERRFFSDSRQQLEKFWGLPDYSEVESRDHLELPSKIHQYIVQQEDKSLDDGRERAAVFGYNAGSVTIDHETIGKDSIKDAIGKSRSTRIGASISDENIFLFSLHTYFGKSRPIFFHNHAGFRLEDLGPITISSESKIYNIRPDLFITVRNFSSEMFSLEDMSKYLGSQRYMNSMLLGSVNRIVYVCPRRLLMPFQARRTDSGYRFQKAVVENAAFSLILGIDIKDLEPTGLDKIRKSRVYEEVKNLVKQRPTLEDLRRLRDEAFISLCNKTGNMLFISNGPTSKTLSRIV